MSHFSVRVSIDPPSHAGVKRDSFFLANGQNFNMALPQYSHRRVENEEAFEAGSVMVPMAGDDERDAITREGGEYVACHTT
jgi:hypothetical protein